MIECKRRDMPATLLKSAEGKSALPSAPFHPTVSGLANLPEDIFVIIVQLLDPTRIVLCRRVCKSWQEAFSSPLGLRLVLKRFYPFAREVRSFDDLINSNGINAVDVFDQVAGRYHNLLMGTPWEIEKIPMRTNTKIDSPHYTVAPFEHLVTDPPFDEKPFRFQPPLWTAEGDLVVYLNSDLKKLLLRDLTTDQSRAVPFDLQDKIVRSIRLRRYVLVVEWAESHPYHRLNEDEDVHRHFATFFDVSIDLESSLASRALLRDVRIGFRNELKLHFFGLPLNRRDRFFSNHDQNHYAIYFWQPNRSMYTGDEEAPIESLAVWDISDPCQYLPSTDPSGHEKPTHSGPQHVHGLGFRELDFYDVRQRDVPSFTGIDIDDNHVYVIETVGEYYGDVRDDGVSDHLELHPSVSDWWPYLWSSRSVGIPFRGNGPHSLEFAPRLISVTEAFDQSARVRHILALDDREGILGLSSPYPDSLSLSTWIYRSQNAARIKLSKDLSKQVIAKGQIAGDERWIIGENDQAELVILRFDTKPLISRRIGASRSASITCA